MEMILLVLNSSASGLIALALIGAILSPRVHDGIIIKIGLICLASGFGAMALRMFGDNQDMIGVQRALLLINAGIAVVIIGYLLRKSKHPKCVKTDWGDLIDTKIEDEYHKKDKP